MTETQRSTDGLSTKPRIKPANAADSRPVSVSARLGRLQFHQSGKFRVLQIADIQDGPKVSKDTIRLIEASLDATRPDLVVFTGNQIAGYDDAFSATFRKREWSDVQCSDAVLESTRETVRSIIGQLVAPMVSRSIPWVVTYGNHDAQCGLTNAELDAIYCEFDGCLNVSAEESGKARGISFVPEQEFVAAGAGTLAFPVRDVENANTVIALALLDSGGYAQGGGFAAPSDETLTFLKSVPERFGVRTMVFQHMPLPQYYDVLKPVEANANYAMQGYRSHDQQYFVLDESRTQSGGYLGEGVSCPDTDAGEFAVLRDSNPQFIGVAAGHDHRNGFVGELDGVLLMATPTCGFTTYGPAPAKRATRLIEFDIRHPYEPRTQLLEFGDLVGKPSSKTAYTYALNKKQPQDGEGDDLLRKPSLWARIAAWFSKGK